MRLLESVPNISEGRDPDVIARIGEALSSAGATLLDVHTDPDHHRSVFTLAGDDDDLVEALLVGIRTACLLVDLERHEGVHPRVGVADVVPIVPLEPGDMPRAKDVAHRLGRRIGRELGLPVFLYGEIGDGRRPAFFRRGGLGELRRRLRTSELSPAYGPESIDPRHGAVLLGARAPLVAFNVELASGDVGIAKEIAAVIRESSGGLPGVQAIGLVLASTGRAQVSMNIVDIGKTELHEVVARVRAEAIGRGVEVARAELVGLLPVSVVRAAAGLAEEDALDGTALTRAAEALLLEKLPAASVLDPLELAAGRA